jgi:hypothetical protein
MYEPYVLDLYYFSDEFKAKNKVKKCVVTRIPEKQQEIPIKEPVIKILSAIYYTKNSIKELLFSVDDNAVCKWTNGVIMNIGICDVNIIGKKINSMLNDINFIEVDTKYFA